MVKFRQVIRRGQHGRDVKAVKDGLIRMKAQGYKKLNPKSDKAGSSFVQVIKNLQHNKHLKVDGVYGAKTHDIVARHFSLFDNWRYRTAAIRKPPKPPAPTTGQAAAKRLLELHQQGKFHDDRGTIMPQIQTAAAGKPVRNELGQYMYLNAKMLRTLVWLIDVKGFKIGCFAMCSDHRYDAPRGHAGGHAVDISSVNGISVSSGSVKPALINLLNALHSAGELTPWQLISGGYAYHSDADCRSRCIPYAGFYGSFTLTLHENHVHMGHL
jgi:hypothetical protein